MKFILLFYISQILLFSQEVEPEILKSLEDKYNSKYRVLLSEDEKKNKVNNGPKSPYIESQDHDWGKVRIDYQKQANIYMPINSDLITVYNTSSGQEAANLNVLSINFESVVSPTESIDFSLEAFSFDINFSSYLPWNYNNYFKNIVISPNSNTPQRMIYFRPKKVGKYEVHYYFENDSEAPGEEKRWFLKGHGVVPNMFLYYDDSGTEVTDYVDFGEVNPNDTLSYNTKTLKIENRPNNPDDGDSLTISSIEWHNSISTEKNNPNNKPFVVDEQEILNKYGTDGDYPIIIRINESIEFDITFVGAEKAIYPTFFNVISDADELGETGPYNGKINLVGNSTASSVKYDKEVFSIYPNPANDILNIELKDIGKIEIIDLEGNIIYRKDILKAGVNEIDISQFSNGTYIIKYYSNQEVYFNKFIKK